MYLALKVTAHRSGKGVQLVQAGRFANDAIKQEFRGAAQAYCPSFRVLFLDGRRPEIRSRIWLAGDLFNSISDNR